MPLELEKLKKLPIELDTVGLEQAENFTPYFCTPIGAELVGSIGCDGVHFVMLPEDERIFCVEPAMGEPGTYVLPVAENLSRFLSYVLYCRDANPISQIWWLSEERFCQLLQEDMQASWSGDEEFSERKMKTLDTIGKVFQIDPIDPYGPVRALQREFSPDCLQFSDEYYDVLGLERDEKGAVENV